MLPGVTVSLINEETGAVRTAVTNAAGEYSFDHVRPDPYSVAAELAGFAPFVRSGVIVGISAFLFVDATLVLGGIEETITVTAETPLIESASASVASAVDRAQLDILPSPGRNVFIMSVGTPNVVHTDNPVWVKPSDQTNSSLLSLGGGPLRGNNYTVDGVAVTDLRNRAVIIPPFEAVEEMKVQTNTYDAEMGRTGGGVFNVVHRHGANEWAGSGLYQFRPPPAEHLLAAARVLPAAGLRPRRPHRRGPRRGPVPPRRRILRRPGLPRPDLLLRLGRGLLRRTDRQHHRDPAERRGGRRRLLRERQDDLRPARPRREREPAAVPGECDPGGPH